MAYVDIEFPRRIALGAQRRAGWKTAIAASRSGRESAGQDWSRTRHSFDVSFAVRTASDYHAITAHFHSMRGRFKHFPFMDVLDYRAEASNGVLIEDAGSPTVFYLAKRYGTGGDAYDRRITRPISGTPVIYRLRTGTTTVITGSCTISTTTGAVTISGGVYSPGDVLSWSGQFYVPSRYDTDDLPALIVNRRPGTTDYGDLLVQCESIPIVEVLE